LAVRLLFVQIPVLYADSVEILYNLNNWHCDNGIGCRDDNHFCYFDCHKVLAIQISLKIIVSWQKAGPIEIENLQNILHDVHFIESIKCFYSSHAFFCSI
jgi:hypothetical protein